MEVTFIFLQLWRPVFKKFDLRMPEQCPLHFSHGMNAQMMLFPCFSLGIGQPETMRNDVATMYILWLNEV